MPDVVELGSDSEEAVSRLLEPIVVGGIELRNRIVMTAHTDHLNVHGHPTVDEIEYLGRRARGGVSLIVLGDTPVHPTALAWGHMPRGQMDDPGALGAFRQLADEIHSHGAAVIAQLNHCGGQAANDFISELPLWAPSELRGMLSNVMAHAMTETEIRDVVEAFGFAAEQFSRAGFDGVELHGGSGYLVQQFHSPLTNARTDRYGGSIENRTRFATEVIARMRECTGGDFLIGYRHTVTEMLPGGYDVEEGVALAQAIAERAELAYVSVVSGSHESYQHHIPSILVPPGVPAAKAREVKQAVRVPVIAAGRVQDPDVGEALLRAGAADLIGMTRALIADPELPNKLRDRVDRRSISPCIAVNYCAARVHVNAPVRCAVNPEAGRELAELAAAPDGRGLSVGVIGGGPAGMEAALTAAALGATVELFEKRSRLGGALADASEFGSRREWRRLVDHYSYRLGESGVALRLSHPVDDVETVEAFDIVVCATGSSWVPGTGEVRGPTGATLGGASVVAGIRASDLDRTAPGTTLVVEVGTGDFIAATLVRELVDRGRAIVTVSPNPQFGAGLDIPSIHALRDLCERASVRGLTNASITRIDGTSVTVRLGVQRESVVVPDVVSIIGGWRRSLVPSFLGALPDRHIVVGDAVAPRGVAQAVREGRRLVREALTERASIHT